MTHGGGGFSSGGGGGGGGSHFHGHHHHSDGDEACGECCGSLIVMGINILSILLCIRKMSRFVRIGLLWLYVLTVVLTVGLLLSLRILGTNEYQAAPTDMRKVDEKINNAFCQSLDVSSSEAFTAFVLDHEPNVDSNRTEQYNASYSTRLLGYQEYEYWGVYLIEGSNLVLTSTADDLNIELFVIKGNSSLQTWIDSQGSCKSCYINKHSVLSPFTDTYKLNVTERDNYFFVYFNTVNTFSSVTAHSYIKRKLFDVSGASATCAYHKGNTPCNFGLSVNPHQSVIVYNNISLSYLVQDINMVTKCYPRAWMYFIVFALVPAPIGLLISLLLWKFCKDDRVQEMTAAADIQYDKF